MNNSIEKFKTVVIVQDGDAREELIAKLRASGRFEIAYDIGDLKNGKVGIQVHCPDILFLDFNVEELNVEDILEFLGNESMQIIFLNDCRQYIIKETELNSFSKSLRKSQYQLIQSDTFLVEEKLMDNIPSGLTEPITIRPQKKYNYPTIGLPGQDGITFVKTCEIISCSANGNYTKVNLTESRTMLISRTLHEFERILDQSLFFRVHNSTIINLLHLKKYIRGDGGYVVMADESTFQVSRHRKACFLSSLVKL